MLKLKMILSAFIVLAVNVILVAQVKIGSSPMSMNPNSVLEIESTNKGLLIPRVALTSTTSFAPLLAHVEGMNVYNTATANDVTPGNYYNDGTNWIKVADAYYNSTDLNASATTNSTTDAVIPGMTLSPKAGTYLVMFNAQFSTSSSSQTSTSGSQPASFSSAQAIQDIQTSYSQLDAIPVTNSTHPLTFGSGEILTPGVYSVGGAISIAGTLTLDGGGDPNALFIIKTSAGALNTSASTTVVLTNGAKANNVFWMTSAALGLGASTTIAGALFSHGGAVAVGAGSTIIGRLFSGTGAISVNSSTISLPSPATSSYVNYGVLQSLVIFTSSGALGNTANSNITGDIGTGSGAISGFGPPSTLNGTTYPPGTTSSSGPSTTPTTSPTTTTTTTNALASFSVYQGGILVANSTRINGANNGQISLQAITTVVAGAAIDIRWNVNTGSSTLRNRILTVLNIN